MLQDFILVYLIIWATSLGLYLVAGITLEWLNARHPERCIQPGRDGLRRKREDIVVSIRALSVSALLLSVGYFAQLQGWTPAPLALSWWSLAIFFALGVVLFDAWFYFGHRLLHWPPLYRFHALHHKAVAPTAWSNDCSTSIDTAIEHGFYLLVWFVLPIPAPAVFALRIFDQISGMIGHSGFEYFASRTARAPWPMICTTFHDLHHSQFRYNFGNFFSVWDRLLGTAHPGYDAMITRMESGVRPGDAASRNGAGPAPQ